MKYLLSVLYITALGFVAVLRGAEDFDLSFLDDPRLSTQQKETMAEEMYAKMKAAGVIENVESDPDPNIDMTFMDDENLTEDQKAAIAEEKFQELRLWAEENGHGAEIEALDEELVPREASVAVSSEDTGVQKSEPFGREEGFVEDATEIRSEGVTEAVQKKAETAQKVSSKPRIIEVAEDQDFKEAVSASSVVPGGSVVRSRRSIENTIRSDRSGKSRNTLARSSSLARGEGSLRRGRSSVKKDIPSEQARKEGYGRRSRREGLTGESMSDASLSTRQKDFSQRMEKVGEEAAEERSVANNPRERVEAVTSRGGFTREASARYVRGGAERSPERTMRSRVEARDSVEKREEKKAAQSEEALASVEEAVASLSRR